MRIKTSNDLLTAAIGLAHRPQPDWLTLAEHLHALYAAAPRTIRHVFKKCGLSVSTGYAYVAIGGRVAEFGDERERLRGIGWAKARLLLPALKPGRAAALIALAEQSTARDLELRLRGATPGLRRVRFDLAPEQAEILTQALIAHGAQPTRRGLRHREAALLDIVARATPPPAIARA